MTVVDIAMRSHRYRSLLARRWCSAGAVAKGRCRSLLRSERLWLSFVLPVLWS